MYDDGGSGPATNRPSAQHPRSASTVRTLARPIGLGLAARGDVDDVVRWARAARDAGLESVWIHDSYFERDAISFGSAVAGALAADGEDDGEAGFRLALGAVNPFTRHPVVLAMTGSALDEILPGRIVMGLGTGLPLRLKQMGIPYEPDAAVAGVSQAMDQLRALWAGERLPSVTPGLPPIQPMFPPTHRIPLVIAAYRKEFVALAGQKADGYLARPAESIPSLRGILERLRAAAVEAGRDPAEIETAGYLLTLVDETRREALNRAKREPFVIYMMSVLSDVSLRRAGFDVELRDRIAAAWRAEDYTTAGNLIPDELLDAFLLCGTREDVAAKAMAYHAETGLGLPLLQPVLQEDRQIDEILAAATLYAGLPTPEDSRAIERSLHDVRSVKPVRVKVANNQVALLDQVGTLRLRTPNGTKTIVIPDVYYWPECPVNLISVGSLTRNATKEVIFTAEEAIIRKANGDGNAEPILRIPKRGRLYVTDMEVINSDPNASKGNNIVQCQ